MTKLEKIRDERDDKQPDLFAMEPTYKPGTHKATAFINDVKYIKSLQDGKGRLKAELCPDSGGGD